MEKRINEIIEKFKSNLQNFFAGEGKSLEEAETYYEICEKTLHFHFFLL